MASDSIVSFAPSEASLGRHMSDRQRGAIGLVLTTPIETVPSLLAMECTLLPVLTHLVVQRNH